MRLIGLHGRLRSGKNEAVEFIREAADPGIVQRAAFADKIKLSAALALGFEPESVEEAIEICNLIKEHYWVSVTDVDNNTFGEVTGREFLQRYGTESHRNIFGEEFWLDALLPRSSAPLYAQFPGTDVLVVTDVRFENEAYRIRMLGGEVWYIEAEQRLGPRDEHISEQLLADHWLTRTVSNNTDLLDFEQAIKKAYHRAD